MSEATAGTWGDPYIGLRHTQAEVFKLTHMALRSGKVWVKMRQISGADPGIFDDIAAFLRTLLSYLEPWRLFDWLRWKVFDPLWEKIRQGWVEPWMKDLRANLLHLQAVISGHIANVRAAIAELPGRIIDALFRLPGLFKSALQGLIELLANAIKIPLAGLRATVSLIPAPIRQAVRESVGWVVDAMRALWQHIVAKLREIRVAIRTTNAVMMALLQNQHGERQKVVNRFERTFAGRLLTSFASALRQLWNTIVAALRQRWRELKPVLIELAQNAIQWARPMVEEWVGAFRQIPATYLNWVAATAGHNLALNPSQALATTGGLYMMSMVAGSAAHAISTALNLCPTLNWVGAQQFSAFIAQAAGFDELTRATYGVLVNEALAWPLRYHWQQRLRPKLPTEGTIFLMGRKRGLSRHEFNQAMAFQGIPDWWLDKIYRFFWSDPSPYWLLRMSEAANPKIVPSDLFLPWLQEWLPGWRSDPWGWYKMKLMLAGFEDTDIPAFIEGFQRRMVGPAITQLKTSVRAMIREGYWSRATALEHLRRMGIREEESDLLYMAEDLDYQKGFLDDEIRYYMESFRKGEISAQDLRLALGTIIVRPERVAQIVAREKVRKLPKPKPMVAAKEDPLVKSLRRQAINSWIKAYRDWQITEDELLVGLTLVVDSRTLAAAMVDAEKLRIRPEPEPPVPPPPDPLVVRSRNQAIASWVKLFRDGEITIEQLDLGLTPLIVDPEIRNLVIELENLRARPTPDLIPVDEEDPDLARAREDAIAAHLGLFRDRRISLSQLYAYLMADGLTPEVAEATAITEANKRIQIPPIESLYYKLDVIRPLIDQGLEAYALLFQTGQITLDAFREHLTALGVDPDLALYLMDLEELRAFLEKL